MSNVSGQYYGANLLEELADLRRRVKALEQALARKHTTARLEEMTGATPDYELPDGAALAGLYLVDESTGDIYRLGCWSDDVRPRLFLRRVSRARMG